MIARIIGWTLIVYSSVGLTVLLVKEYGRWRRNRDEKRQRILTRLAW